MIFNYIITAPVLLKMKSLPLTAQTHSSCYISYDIDFNCIQSHTRGMLNFTLNLVTHQVNQFLDLLRRSLPDRYVKRQNDTIHLACTFHTGNMADMYLSQITHRVMYQCFNNMI